MSSLKSFKSAIADFNKQFGKDAQLIDALPVTEYEKEEIKEKQQKIVAEKVAIPPAETKAVPYKRNDISYVRHSFLRHLQATGYEFVIDGFQYQGNTMDVFAMANDMAIEFAIAITPEDLKKELDSIYRFGKMVIKKHPQLSKGKGMPNFFFFVVPDFFEPIAQIPPYAGIIKFYFRTGDIFPSFSIVRAAQVLHIKKTADGTYKTIARRFERRNKSLIAKYSKAIFDRIEASNGNGESLFD